MTDKSQQQFFEDMLERDARVIALHSTDIEGALVRFRLVCRSTGRAMYHWSEAHGMVSFKAADITVPGARKLVDALRYVEQSMHYGVYIFTQFERQLHAGAAKVLGSILALTEPRTVILLGARIALPAQLADHVEHIADAPPPDTALRPRLRDGRWVL